MWVKQQVQLVAKNLGRRFLSSMHMVSLFDALLQVMLRIWGGAVNGK